MRNPGAPHPGGVLAGAGGGGGAGAPDGGGLKAPGGGGGAGWAETIPVPIISIAVKEMNKRPFSEFFFLFITAFYLATQIKSFWFGPPIILEKNL